MKAVCVIAYTHYATDARMIHIAESLRRAGCQVDVLTPLEGLSRSNRDQSGIRLYHLPIHQYQGDRTLVYIVSYLTFLLLCCGFLAKRLIRDRYGIVYVNNIPDFLVFSTFPNKLLGAKVILDIHDPMPETYLAKFGAERRGLFYQLLKLQEKWSAAYADQVITVHEPVKRDILVKDGIPADKITVITNFADGNIFFPDPDYRIASPLRLIYYGTISSRFGLEDVIKCLARLKRKDALFFKIIGTGDAATDLKTAIQASHLTPMIDFENRTYPVREIPEIIKHYHLGIVPYRPSRATNYMLPVKMLELTAAGIPVVTTANTAIKYYFDDSLYFGYDPLRPQTLTGLLDRLIEHPELMTAKRVALLRARPRFLWQNEAGKLTGLVLNLSKRGSRE
jgi:glycosyltransferase involved in cell wall biosynthesis